MEKIVAHGLDSRFLFLKKGEELEETFLKDIRIITIYPQEDRDIIEYITHKDDVLLSNNRNFKDLRNRLKRTIERLEEEIENLLKEEESTRWNALLCESVPETEEEKKERQKAARIKRVTEEQILHTLRKVMEGFNGD